MLPGYKSFIDAKKAKKDDEDAADEDDDMVSNDSLDKGYDYLLSMKIWSLTMEKVNELVQQRDGKKGELDTLACKSPEDLWLEDLDALENALDDYDQSFEDAKSQEAAAQQKASRNAANKKGGGKKPKKASKYDSDDSDGMGFDGESDYDSDVKPKKKSVKAAPVISKPSTKVTGTRLVNNAVVNAAVEKPVRAPKAPKPEKTSPQVKVAKAATVVAPVMTSSTTLSLAERLAMLKGKTISSTLSSIASTTSYSVPMTVDDDEPIATITASRAPRATKAVPKKVIDYSDDEEKDDFSGDDSDVLSDELVESESDFDDYDSDDKKSKKTKAEKPTKVAAPVFAPKTVSTSTKGIKRAPKQGGAAITSSKQQVYSPDQATPKVTKKQKKVDVKPKAVKKGTTKVSKKKSFSDDESDVSDEGDDEVVVKRTPKPARQRKTTNYAAYLDEDSEGDDLVDSEEYSDAE